MKIEDYTQQIAVVPHLIAARTDRVESTESQPEPAAKSASKTDKVQLSGMSPVAADHRDLELSRGQRIEALKASVASGAYEIPARAIAEKMLSKLVVGGTKH